MLTTRLETIMPLTWWVICGLALLTLISLIFTVLLYRRTKHFETSHIALQTFMSGNQLDTLLEDCIKKIEELDIRLQKTDSRLTPIEDKLRDSLDRIELMRFRAFEDVGSDISFALTLLNQEGDGVVISAIHNRDESRVYGKPVKGGNSTYSLTEEEKTVILKAMKGKKIL